jgi:histidyl-tRNA synthetase
MSFQPPKGTNDIAAPQSHEWRSVLGAWDRWAERFGYPLVMTPVFEATELFERGVGDATEVVSKQMYTFEDKGGRSLTLRPEGTAGVVRAFLDSGAQGAWKGAYSGPFFRYERPQGGRRRQFWQVGVEYMDVDSPLADAEVIELGYRFLDDVGVRGLELQLNSLGDGACRPAYIAGLRDFLRDMEDELSEASVELIEKNPLRVLDSKVDGPKLIDAPRTTDALCDECSTHYETVKTTLTRVGVPFVEDPVLVRGLDYYTRTAFEFVGRGLDVAQNAVGGGGRYDGLAESIGGRAAPGVGFALGLDRIILARDSDVGPVLDVYLVSETTSAEALVVASQLRVEGLRVDFDTEGRSVKAQFRSGRRSEALAIVVVKDGTELVDVQVEGERAEMPPEEVAGWLKRQDR